MSEPGEPCSFERVVNCDLKIDPLREVMFLIDEARSAVDYNDWDEVMTLLSKARRWIETGLRSKYFDYADVRWLEEYLGALEDIASKKSHGLWADTMARIFPQIVGFVFKKFAECVCGKEIR